MAEKRYRRYTTGSVEVRQVEDRPPMISGYAAVFNEEAVIADRFREVIRPGAFARMVANPPSDLKALYNHDPNEVIGAISNGTLRISEDAKGLRYEVDINTDDPAAMSVLAKIRRGDVNKSSFAFGVTESGQDIERGSPGQLPLRIVKEAELFDVSPVAFPAYAGSSVSARSEEVEADAAVAEAISVLGVDAAAQEPSLAWRASVELSRARCRFIEKT